MAVLSIERLKEVLEFNPETGVFVRKTPARISHSQAGRPAGHLAADGYRYIRVDATRYLEHRLVWFYVHGRWPQEIDHTNGLKSDNRICNLREASRSQNMANGPRQRNNSSGAKGVCFDAVNSRWMAYVYLNGRFKNIGRFDSFGAAVAARQEASRKAFGEFARA